MRLIRINTRELVWWIYVFTSTLCPNVLVGQLAMGGFLLSVCLSKVSKSVLFWKKYILFEILFLLYSIFQCFGVAASSYDAMQMCKTVFTCLMFDMAFLSFSSSYDIGKVLRVYVNGTFWGFVACLLLYGNTIGNKFAYSGRLTSAIVLQFGPISIFGHSPTALAAIASNALVVAMIVYWKKNKKTAIGYLMFFTIIILLTQSRKNIVFVLAAAILIPYFYSGKKFNVRKFKILLVSVILVSAIFIAIIKVPYLYKHFGQRLMSVFSGFWGIGVNERAFGESSIRTRAELISKAIKALYERPIFGWGLNNFSAVINNGGYYAHNNFMEILVSGGVVGFCIYYSKYIFIAKKLLKSIYTSEDTLKEVCKISFQIFMIYCVLEYWQITYMFRFIYILPLLLLQYAKMGDV